MPKTIQEWEWDEGNITELGRHGATPKTVRQVAEGSPKFRSNKKGRAATHQMIGPDAGGGIWVMCILQLEPWEKGRWRAVTGWRANDAETAWYGRQR